MGLHSYQYHFEVECGTSWYATVCSGILWCSMIRLRHVTIYMYNIAKTMGPSHRSKLRLLQHLACSPSLMDVQPDGSTVYRYSSQGQKVTRIRTTSKRVQVSNIQGLWSQKPLRVWFLEPTSLNIEYLDPLGMQASPKSKRISYRDPKHMQHSCLVGLF